MTQQNPDEYSVKPPNSPPPAFQPPPAAATPPPPSAAPGASPYAGPAPSKDDITMATLAHLLGIIGFVGPLIIWLVKKDQSPFVDDQGKEALNFHITMLIGWIVAYAVAHFICVGFLLILAVYVVSVVFSVIGGMTANKGIAYRYPVSIRVIK